MKDDTETKALVNSAAVGSESGGLIQPDVQPTILPILFPPAVVDVIPGGVCSTGLVRFRQEKTATTGAAGVPESTEGAYPGIIDNGEGVRIHVTAPGHQALLFVGAHTGAASLDMAFYAAPDWNIIFTTHWNGSAVTTTWQELIDALTGIGCVVDVLEGDPDTAIHSAFGGIAPSSSIEYEIGGTAIGLKPESTMEYDATDSAAKKFATLMPVADEMLEDLPQLESYVGGRLMFFIRHGEVERQLLWGVGGDELDGLMSFLTGPNTGVTSDDFEATASIRHALGNVARAQLVPDAIVINPADYDAIYGLKVDNGYVGGNPMAMPVGGPSLWGIPCVLTDQMPRGTALVGAFAMSTQLFRHGGTMITTAVDHEDNFAHDISVIRVEQRLALVVYRPEGLATADISDLVAGS